VAVLTALSVESQAVQALLSFVRKQTEPPGTVYRIGTFSGETGRWKVVEARVGPGNPRAAEETVRVIEKFRPKVLLFVGVAGGLKEVRLGDVVAATKIYAYESGKAAEKFLARPEVANPGYDLEQRAFEVEGETRWLRRICPDPPAREEPRAYVKPIAAGEKVVASNRSSTYRLLRREYGDALAVEMEGYGCLRAAHAYAEVSAIVVRGISDLIENKEASDTAGWQEVASHHAAAFAFELLTGLAQVRPGGELPWFLPRGYSEIDEHEGGRLVQCAKTPSEAWDITDYLVGTRACRPCPAERYWTNVALGRIGGEEAEEALREGLSDADRFARQGAKEGLKLLRQKGGKTHD
jgi:nucleoside phosphorylase